MLRIPEPQTSPAARWTPAGRFAAAGTLILGASFELLANSIGPQRMPTTTLEEMQWAASQPARANLVLVFALLAVPFLVGSVLVYVLLSRQRSPRLAYTGGGLLGFGTVTLSAVEGYQVLAVAFASDGRISPTALAGAIEEVSSLSVVVMFLMFIPFAFFGLLVSAVALWRSEAVPRGAVLLIPTFVIVDFFLHEGFGVVPEFAGPAVALVSACWIASAVLRPGTALASESVDSGPGSLD